MRIALVEDDPSDLQLLKTHIQKYADATGIEIITDDFLNSFVFLENTRTDYDLVVFDIETPVMNGLEGAQKLRERNPNVPIVFETNMKQYAVKGYSVNALDFIFKPVTYFALETVLNKVKKIMTLSADKDVLLIGKGTIRHLISTHILYAEVYRHKLTVHTLEGDYETWMSLNELETQLSDKAFSKCSSGILVNLKYVNSLEKDVVMIGKTSLPVARSRKKEFINDLTSYLGRHK